MHFQAMTAGWKEALLQLPDESIFKAFSAGDCREAKLTWAEAGRDPRLLTTVFRHHDVYTAPEGSWADAVSHWRAMFRRWADRTFFDGAYWRYIDIVSESNEYTAWSTWDDPTEAAKALRNVQAAAYVWNTDYRGKLVPAEMRIGLLASPVSNGWPKLITQTAIDTDNYLDYHAYMLCVNGVRHPDDWRGHSGLFNTIEQSQGLRPRWLFGEAGLYLNAAEGWRHPNCSGQGDINQRRARMQALLGDNLRDIRATAAFREKRIAGRKQPLCLFTSGNVGWEWYQYYGEDLMAAALTAKAVDDAAPPDLEDDMEQLDPARKARIFAHLDAIRAELNAITSILYRVRTIRGVQVRDVNGNPLAADPADPLTGVIPAGVELDVYAEFPLPPHGNRVAIHPDKRNVWVNNVERLP